MSLGRVEDGYWVHMPGWIRSEFNFLKISVLKGVSKTHTDSQRICEWVGWVHMAGGFGIGYIPLDRLRNGHDLSESWRWVHTDFGFQHGPYI